MPRGRFISKSMNENARLEVMPIDCVDFFKRVVSIADVEGRLKGDSKYLSKILYPLRDDITSKMVDGWLNGLWDSKDDDTGLGLLERYTVGKHEYIWLPGFDKHQKGLRKDREAPSEIPPPEGFIPEQIKPVPAEIKTDDLKVAGMIKYYEDELGKALTPTDYEKLKDFADNYPDGFFEKAVDEVKNSPKTIRSPIQYIGKIMENWREKETPVETSGDNQGIETI